MQICLFVLLFNRKRRLKTKISSTFLLQTNLNLVTLLHNLPVSFFRFHQIPHHAVLCNRTSCRIMYSHIVPYYATIHQLMVLSRYFPRERCIFPAKSASPFRRHHSNTFPITIIRISVVNSSSSTFRCITPAASALLI